MITVEITERELKHIVYALRTKKHRKEQKMRWWQRKAEQGLLTVPKEKVAEFREVDTNIINDVINPMIERFTPMINEQERNISN